MKSGSPPGPRCWSARKNTPGWATNWHSSAGSFPGYAGTDIYGYLTELFGFTAFTLEDGTTYQTYSTTGRGVEFLMPYYGFLDRAPKGRDEDEGWQLWIRRHDEYTASDPPTTRKLR